MLKSDYIIYGILAVAALILIYTIFGVANSNSSAAVPQNSQNNIVTGFKTISTGSTETESVQIDLTPKGTVNGQFQVDFSINTHSVDLSQYDLAKITTLEHDGKKVPPISAPKLEGHHSSGILLFGIAEDLTAFKIIIKGIPNVQERIFEWR